MAWIGAVIQGASALYGAYQQSRQGKKQGSLVQQQIDTSKQLGGIGTGMMQEGANLQAPATTRLLSLAKGNRGQAWQAIAPEAADISARSDEAQRVGSELMGRGGGRAAVLAGEPYRKIDALNRLYMGERRNAFDQLLQLGDVKQRLGLGAIGGSLGGLQGAASGQLNLARFQAGESEKLGSSMADAWKSFYQWYSTRGGGAYPSPDSGQGDWS